MTGGNFPKLFLGMFDIAWKHLFTYFLIRIKSSFQYCISYLNYKEASTNNIGLSIVLISFSFAEDDSLRSDLVSWLKRFHHKIHWTIELLFSFYCRDWSKQMLAPSTFKCRWLKKLYAIFAVVDKRGESGGHSALK